MSRRPGPLAAFFDQYAGFHYNRSKSASSEFRRLCNVNVWDRYERDDAREEYKEALIHQFNLSYGTDVDALESWKLLCKYIGMDPLPDTLEGCKRVCIMSWESVLSTDGVTRCIIGSSAHSRQPRGPGGCIWDRGPCSGV